MVAKWLKYRGSEPGPLICAAGVSGKVEVRPLTGQGVLDILRRRALDTGVQSFTPHDLRRTCASELWDAGVDGVTIQRILGHASIETTARYDRREEYATRAAAEKIKLPI